MDIDGLDGLELMLVIVRSTGWESTVCKEWNDALCPGKYGRCTGDDGVELRKVFSSRESSWVERVALRFRAPAYRTENIII